MLGPDQGCDDGDRHRDLLAVLVVQTVDPLGPHLRDRVHLDALVQRLDRIALDRVAPDRVDLDPDGLVHDGLAAAFDAEADRGG